MQKSIKVLSDVKDLSNLLTGARIERIELVKHRSRYKLKADIVRPEIEKVAPGDLNTRHVPIVSSMLTLENISNVSKAAPDSHKGALFACDAVAGGYICSLSTADGQVTTLELDSLNGTFTDI